MKYMDNSVHPNEDQRASFGVVLGALWQICYMADRILNAVSARMAFRESTNIRAFPHVQHLLGVLSK